MLSGKTVLVTGASGFVGQHLVRRLQQNKAHVVGTGLHAADVKGLDRFYVLDIMQAAQVTEIVESTKPDFIVHLAAQSHVGHSFKVPSLTTEINVLGTLNILEAIKSVSDARLIYISSGDVYGLSFHQSSQVDETTPCLPMNPYSSSKLAAETFVGQYVRSFAQKSVILRPLNHFGVGQETTFAIASFAEQIRQMMRGQKEPVLRVGNLDVERDFLPVSSVIDAYLAVMQQFDQLASGEIFNISSGQSSSLRNIVEQLIQVSDKEIEIVVDQDLMRVTDIPKISASSKKLQQQTGWAPVTDLHVALQALVEETC